MKKMFLFGRKKVDRKKSLIKEAKTEPTHGDKLAMAATALVSEPPKPEVEATYYGHEYHINEKLVDGEKSYNSLGAPNYYTILHESLSARSWELYADSGIAKMIIDQYVEWVVGQGLKLEAEPDSFIIEKQDPKFDSNAFAKSIEHIYSLYANSTLSSHSQVETFNTYSAEAYKSSMIGGDCLLIYRYEDGVPTMEVVDGRDVCDPSYQGYYENLKEGHKIIMGVELGSKGEHVAYYVRQDNVDAGDVKKQHVRHEARGKETGRVNAVMIYGSKYRVNGVRGMPLYACDIEKLKGLDRYVEAIIGGTEERAKIPYFTEHNHFSDGRDPLARGLEHATTGKPGDPAVNFDVVNKNIKYSYNKEVINMPPGATLKAIESTLELRVGDFLRDNIIYICAAAGIPYEFVTMLYTDSFSASRMSTQSFQHKLDTETHRFAKFCHQPYYDILLETEILKGNVPANGYFKNVIQEEDKLLRLAYHKARFIGSKVPSADPSKDVKASVMRMQNYLTTIAKETETLNLGDSTVNIERYGQELETLKKVIPKEFLITPNADSDTAEFTNEPKANPKPTK